ncbi:MAG: chemotaxis response regulator protein-glutamate methylesterase [Firmicutes bacterium]|nr:chemotaxis response regulator protein-glutamate methylesterase [Bacillota bacterium]
MDKKKIRVLVVDDSIVFRELIIRGLAADDQIEVVATASDPFEARDMILKYHPDVMTCDIEMPKMNGIEFIRRLLPQYPLPVIVVSIASGAVFDALDAGAVEFLSKPDMTIQQNLDNFLTDLAAKIKIASRAKVPRPKRDSMGQSVPAAGDWRHQVIAVGASTGGTEAISQLLQNLPPTLPGMVVVQHIPPVFSRLLAERLDQQTAFKVKEAESGDYVTPGSVLIAPGDFQMRLKKVGSRYKVVVSPGEKVNGHRPSVDVLFHSVAKEAGDRAVGIILTGMGADGAKGLLAMRKQGARTIGQDEETSVVYGMPKAAYEIGAVEKQSPLHAIPQTLLSVLRKNNKH